jgi:hypothetical protein
MFSSVYCVVVVPFLFFYARPSGWSIPLAILGFGAFIFILFSILNYVVILGMTLLAFSLPVALVLFGLLLFGYQIIHFLKSGDWTHYPLFYFAARIFDLSEIRNPAAWIGLKRIVCFLLDWTPATLFAVIAGVWMSFHVPDEEEMIKSVSKK